MLPFSSLILGLTYSIDIRKEWDSSILLSSPQVLNDFSPSWTDMYILNQGTRVGWRINKFSFFSETYAEYILNFIPLQFHTRRRTLKAYIHSARVLSVTLGNVRKRLNWKEGNELGRGRIKKNFMKIKTDQVYSKTKRHHLHEWRSKSNVSFMIKQVIFLGYEVLCKPENRPDFLIHL